MAGQSQLVSVLLSSSISHVFHFSDISTNSMVIFFTGSRITTIFNFGYVSLNILHLRAEDAGSYTVRAVNRLGEAVSSASLRVFGQYSIKCFEAS